MKNKHEDAEQPPEYLDDTDDQDDYERNETPKTRYQRRQAKAKGDVRKALSTIAEHVLEKAPVPPRIPKDTDLKIGSDKEIADRVVSKMKSDFGETPFAENAFWKYTSTHWAEIPDQKIEKAIHRFDGAWYPPGGIIRLTSAKIKSIKEIMFTLCGQPKFFDDALVGANFKDGFLAPDRDAEKLIFGPHDPLQRQRYVLPASEAEVKEFSIDDLRKGNSLLGKLFTGSFKGDPEANEKLQAIGEAFGAGLFGLGTRIRSPKAIVFLGSSAENGKSQFIDLARGILPPNVVSRVAPDQFGDKDYLAELAGRLLNTSDELGTAKAIASDKFKSVITGNPLTTRIVYRPAMYFKPGAQHIFATNELPSFTGGFDRGTHRRLLVIDFKRVIPKEEQIPELAVRILRDEMDMLLAFAIDGASRLLRNGKFTEPKSSIDSLEDWAGTTDPVVGWAQDRVVDNRHGMQDVNGKVPEKTTREAFDDFEQWYVAEGHDARRQPQIRTFTQRAKALGPKYGYEYKASHGNRKFVGMILKEKTKEMTQPERRMEGFV